MAMKRCNRRNFLGLTGIAAVASVTSTGQVFGQTDSGFARSDKPLFNLGLASYTLREFKLERVLEITKKLDLKYICFKDFHLALNSTPEQISYSLYLNALDLEHVIRTALSHWGKL